MTALLVAATGWGAAPSAADDAPPEAAPTYTVTVESQRPEGCAGKVLFLTDPESASASVAADASVGLYSQLLSPWFDFDGWEADDPDLEWETGHSAVDYYPYFRMPAHDVTVTVKCVDRTPPGHERLWDVWVVAPPVGGTAEASRTSAYVGDRVALTATPAAGYRFDGWSATGKNGLWDWNESERTSPTAVFTMPDDDVWLVPIFRPGSAVDDQPGGYGSGSVYVNNEDDGGVAVAWPTHPEPGDRVDAWAEPLPGLRFSGWHPVGCPLEYVEGSETDARMAFRMPSGPNCVMTWLLPTFERAYPSDVYELRVDKPRRSELRWDVVSRWSKAGRIMSVDSWTRGDSWEFDHWNFSHPVQWIRGGPASVSGTFLMPASDVVARVVTKAEAASPAPTPPAPKKPVKPPVEKVTVTFDVGAGRLPSSAPRTRLVVKGDRLGTLPVPKRSGYVFTGWRRSGGREMATAGMKVTRNLKLVAVWVKKGAAVRPVAKAVPLRKAPKGKARVVARVRAGASLTVLARKGSWLRVRVSGGQAGWLRAARLA
jgi:hypothetical protein